MSSFNDIKYKHDGKTTYCWYIGETYDDKPSTITEDSVLSEATGDKCPVQVSVDISDDIKVNEYVKLRYTAEVDSSRKPLNFEFSTPITQGEPPSYLSSSDTSASGTSDKYDVPVAYVEICDWRSCEPFMSTDSKGSNVPTGNFYTSSNNPRNFENSIAVFGSQEIKIPKDGKYTGLVHLTMNIAGNSRADFVTFFPVLIGGEPGAVPDSIKPDSETTFCWVSEDTSPFAKSVDGKLNVRFGDNCPVKMKAILSSDSITTDENVDIDWSVAVDESKDGSKLIGEVSSSNAVENPDTGVYSVIPQAVLSACNQDGDSSCTVYSGGGSGTNKVESWKDTNMTDDAASFRTTHKFAETGKYLLISRAVMETIDGLRLDTAVYSSITVTLPSTGSNSTFLYVGICIGVVILLLGLFFCFWYRRRRQRRAGKNVPFRQPMPPTSVMERSSQYTDGNRFLSHHSPPSERGLHGANMHYGQKGAHGIPTADPVGGYERGHNDSFSLDPYSRPSFNNMTDDDTPSSVSGISKFSFQTEEFDGNSEWKVDSDSRSQGRTMASDASSDHRGTFQFNRSGERKMPRVAEDDDSRIYHNRREADSDASSDWTMNTRRTIYY